MPALRRCVCVSVVIVWSGVLLAAQDAALLQRAGSGDAAAQKQLCLEYQKNSGKKNDREAAKWCQKAAEQGDAEAHFEIANMYHQGRGLRRDYRQAMDW